MDSLMLNEIKKKNQEELCITYMHVYDRKKDTRIHTFIHRSYVVICIYPCMWDKI